MSGSAASPTSSANRPDSNRLNPSHVGACLRSAFIEALYDDCTDMLPPDEKEPPAAPSSLAAE